MAMRTTHLLVLSLLLVGCEPVEPFSIGGPAGGSSLDSGCMDYEPGTGSVALEAVSRLNCYRNLMGLEPVAHDGALAAAAQAHAEYMNATDEYGHVEADATHALFSGASPSARAAAGGFDFDSSQWGMHEVVAFFDSGSDPSRAVDLWMNTIYHREPLSTPGLSRVGFGSSGIYSVMEIIAPWESDGSVTLAMYPAPGQDNADTSFDTDRETPDPVPGLGEVGLPITVTALAPLWLNDDDPYGLRINRAATRLQSGSGEERPLVFLDPEDQSALLRTAAAIPAEPLPPYTTWDVTFVFTLDGVDYERAWSFATGP
jgi:hypothetical protein